METNIINSIIYKIMKKRNQDEEHLLSQEIYFGDSYFTRRQLKSLGEQIYLANRYGGESMLEVGLGNGFVSSFMKRSGKQLVTIDVNPDLNPDYLGSIVDEPYHFQPKEFDTVLCFEVLEHLPWDLFRDAIQSIAILSKGALILSLPRAKQTGLNISGTVKFFKFQEKSFDFTIEKKRKDIYSGHHWELEWKSFCSVKAVTEILKENFSSVSTYTFSGNRYHQFFICKH